VITKLPPYEVKSLPGVGIVISISLSVYPTRGFNLVIAIVGVL